eukprot:TRINITY_DN5814_c0_g2_i9.p1 TRINITY_DN5814_c0_g2~~TRINITY_DN5814_c0_g2_i9.p1  ORF type:complete len:323 (+),score=41.26 TRINITY_DN5814_c0_g2_i9:115-1083(+)
MEDSDQRIRVYIYTNNKSEQQGIPLAFFQKSTTYASFLNQLSNMKGWAVDKIFDETGKQVNFISELKNNQKLIVTQQGEAFTALKKDQEVADKHNSSKIKCYKQYKIAVIGPSGAGKTCITNKFLTNQFLSNVHNTLMDTHKYNYHFNDKLYALDIFDTAGEDKYFYLQDEWIQQNEGFLVVFSVNDRESFKGVQNSLQRYKQLCPENSGAGSKPVRSKPAILLGNKVDMDKRMVTTQEGQQLAQQYNIPYLDVSAKIGTNIELAFQNLLQQLDENKEQQTTVKEYTPQQFLYSKPFCDCCILFQSSSIYDYNIQSSHVYSY